VDIISIDMEDHETSGIIPTLKSLGKSVVCYISAGSFEEWRSDANQFTSSDLGNPLGNCPGEYYLDI